MLSNWKRAFLCFPKTNTCLYGSHSGVFSTNMPRCSAAFRFHFLLTLNADHFVTVLYRYHEIPHLPFFLKGYLAWLPLLSWGSTFTHLSAGRILTFFTQFSLAIGLMIITCFQLCPFRYLRQFHSHLRY